MIQDTLTGVLDVTVVLAIATPTLFAEAVGLAEPNFLATGARITIILILLLFEFRDLHQVLIMWNSLNATACK